MNKRPSIPADLVPEALRFALADPPEVAMILGSGLGHIANSIETPIKVPATAIPNYPASTVAGHEGDFVVGRLAGHRAIVPKGRVHSYEGHSMSAVATPVRIFAALGVRFVVLTNAAGGINRDFQPGDLMAITDHLNLTRQSPLTGRNADEYGPRFPDQSQVYPSALRQALRDHAEKQGVKIHTGVYACLPGPEYETPAEIRMLRILGAGAVGMSTVPEARRMRGGLWPGDKPRVVERWCRRRSRTARPSRPARVPVSPCLVRLSRSCVPPAATR